MKKKILSLFAAACCIISGANAQIVGPATTTGTATFSSPAQAVTYTWDFNGLTMNPVAPSSLAPIIPAGSLNVPSYGCFVKDNNAPYHYFYYVNEYNTGNMWCYDFGTTFPSVPAPPVLIGNYGAWQELEGLDLVQDGSGHWYGLAINNNSLIELDMVAGLGVPVSAVNTNIVPVPTYWAHKLCVTQFDAASGGGWHAFVADRNSTIWRFDFGVTISSLMSTPTFTSIPNSGGVYTPCNFALWHQVPPNPNPGWYMLVPSLISADMTVYSFGSDLRNMPAAIPEPHNQNAYLFRDVSIYSDCTGQLFALQFNESGDLLQYTWPTSDMSVPLVPANIADLGASGGYSLGSGCPASATSGPGGINSYNYLLPNFGSGEIDIYNPFIPLTPNSYADYFVSTQTNTFTASSPITLIYDMGRPSGPSMTGMVGAVACSQIQLIQQDPCYNEQQSILNVTQSLTDPCTFTACVNIATTNAITGYTWDVEPGGLIYDDPSTLPTDCFTFSILPGVVYTVTVTAHIFEARTKTCCEAVLSQMVECGGPNPVGPGGPAGKPAHTDKTDVGVGSDITVFPNPTNSAVSITSSNTPMNNIQLFDMWGKKLRDNNYDGAKETSVSLDKLPAGTYIIRINSSISKIITKSE